MPDSWFAVIWERVVLASLLTICFVYTFVASFSISLHAIGYGENVVTQVILVITYLLDVVLVADFIMRFNMASDTTTGRVVWNLDLTTFQGNGPICSLYIEGLLYQKPWYNEFVEKHPKCSLYRGIADNHWYKSTGVLLINAAIWLATLLAIRNSIPQFTVLLSAESKRATCKSLRPAWRPPSLQNYDMKAQQRLINNPFFFNFSLELKDIRKSYKWSLLFWIDLLAILPIEIFATLQTDFHQRWHSFAFLRLNRLLKAIRVS